MAASLSVLVTTANPGRGLAELVAAWDAQSAPSEQTELVVLDAGSSDGSVERLRQLAGRRPNVVLVDGAADTADALRRAVAGATGSHVMLLDQEQRLTPRALELMVRQTERSGADVVLGRAPGAFGSGSEAVPGDLVRVDPVPAAAAQPHSVAAVRRDLLIDADDLPTALSAPLVARPDLSVAAVGASAVAVRRVAATTAPLVADLGDVTADWRGGRLELSARVGVEGEDAPSAWLVAAASNGLAELTTPASVEPAADGSTPDGAWTVQAALDPATIASGDPIADGVWDLRLRLASPTAEVTLPLPVVSQAAAVVDGRLLALTSAKDALQLDVGSIRTSVIAEVAIADASVVESAAGSLLTLRYPAVHVHGDAVVPARIRLDKFGLAAHLVCEGGAARLECFVTGLAGTSVITAYTGKSRPRDTGLGLDIDEIGAMSLVPASSKPESAPVRKAPHYPVARPSAARSSEPPQPAAGGSAPAGSVVQRVRRHLPAALDPAVKRLSKVPALRKAYRAVIGLKGR